MLAEVYFPMGMVAVPHISSTLLNFVKSITSGLVSAGTIAPSLRVNVIESTVTV
jgi:hypothetical protein